MVMIDSSPLVRWNAAHRLVPLKGGEMRGADTCTYPTLQLQVGEHLHCSPQLQPLFWTVVFASWQPHLQTAPAQDVHLHFFVFIDIGISSSL